MTPQASPVTERAYTGPEDWQQIITMLSQVRRIRPHSDHIGDHLWASRFDLKEPEQNIRLWQANPASRSFTHTGILRGAFPNFASLINN